jgi:serine/threonine-protein kinase HipA
MSRISSCLDAAHHFLLSPNEAINVVENQIVSIGENWSSVCDIAELNNADRALLWGRQFLNTYAFDDLEGNAASPAKLADEIRAAIRQ